VVKLVQAGNTPKVYIKTIAELEDFMNESIAKQKVSTRKMNATNARGLNAVKQRIKKNNKDYQKEIDAYKADKDAFMESEEEEEEVVPKKAKKLRLDGDLGISLDEDDEGFSTVGKGGRTLQFTPESILKHLRTIMESRGKKNTDRAEQIKIMERLHEVATTPYQRVRVLLNLISTRFDLSTGVQTFMPQDQWKSAEQEFATLLNVLESNPELVVIENAEEWEDDDKAPTITPGEKFKIPGSIVSYAERLDDELTRSLQHIDPHTAEYIDRLSDEGALYNNIVRTLLYTEGLSKDASLQTPQDGLNRIVMRRLEHVYFKVSVVGLFYDLCSNLFFSSHLRSSRYSKRTAGSQSPQNWIPPSPRVTRDQMLQRWSTFFATIFSLTAKASSELELCFAKYTSLPCMTITIRHAT
jgi:translation initiation factor 3 subunit C